MLARPAVTRPAAVVVGPDDLVEEALRAEDLIQQQPDVMDRPPVHVQVQRAVRGQHAADLDQPCLERRQVLRERQVVLPRLLADHLVGYSRPPNPRRVRSPVPVRIDARRCTSPVANGGSAYTRSTPPSGRAAMASRLSASRTAPGRALASTAARAARSAAVSAATAQRAALAGQISRNAQ